MFGIMLLRRVDGEVERRLLGRIYRDEDIVNRFCSNLNKGSPDFDRFFVVEIFVQ